MVIVRYFNKNPFLRVIFFTYTCKAFDTHQYPTPLRSVSFSKSEISR